MRKSPCCFCEKKDYAGGCSIGCKEHEAFTAETAELCKYRKNKNLALGVLADATEKSKKRSRKIK